jgi:Ca2+-binding EF-hand superfamily protein
LATIGGTIQKNLANKNQLQAAQEISGAYIRHINGITQQTWDKAQGAEKEGYWLSGMMNCIMQLNAINEVGQDARVQKGNDFMNMIHVERVVTRAQAIFRQKLAMKKLQKEVERDKAKLARKKNQARASTEQLVLQEFKQRLAKKGLTPESFYRACDDTYSKTVPVEKFKQMLLNFNLQLSRAQTSRLVLILDEDMEGNITLEEFYNAIEAYGTQGEKHGPIDGSDYYVSFEHRAMFKLLNIMGERNISYMELFRSCDVNNDQDVNISELETVLTGLSAEFYQKDVTAIHNFFDIDKNNLCTESEFLSQLKKAERLLIQHQERKAGARPGTAGSLRGMGMTGFSNQEGLNQYIHGYNESSPRTQGQKLTDYLANELHQKGI